jgi:hypothetical protein
MHWTVLYILEWNYVVRRRLGQSGIRISSQMDSRGKWLIARPLGFSHRSIILRNPFAIVFGIGIQFRLLPVKETFTNLAK